MSNETVATEFPSAFGHYKPRSHRVYGAICMSPLNTVLLVRGRRSGKWSFPKGHMEGSELALETAKRELYEETGIAVSDRRPIGFQKLSAASYYYFEFPYEITPTVRDSDEVVEARWLALHELRRKECNVDVNAFLDRVRQTLRRNPEAKEQSLRNQVVVTA